MTDEDKIIAALSNANTAMSGWQIKQVTRIWPLILYQVLGKLERSGVIESEWGDGSYLPRLLYRLRP